VVNAYDLRFTTADTENTEGAQRRLIQLQSTIM
jgi:hypothetical protein